MATCPDGHESDSDDYCSVCGLAMGSVGSDVAAGSGSAEGRPAEPELASGDPANSGLACPHCGEAHGRDDVFCENCGYDFITGSLPAPEPAITSSGGAVIPRDEPAAPLAHVTVAIDPDHHARMDTEGVLELPDPVPAPRSVPITTSPTLIGRTSASRNIYPDLDVSDDPAASGRHARLELRSDGAWTITDLGSTNGTYVGASPEPLEPNTPVVVDDGVPVYVGAWTRLDLASPAAP